MTQVRQSRQVPEDLHPALLATLHLAEGRIDGYDVWTCRECGACTALVVVVENPYAWKYAVKPLCLEHYPPEHLHAPLCTDGWPGPATLPKYAREAREREDVDA